MHYKLSHMDRRRSVSVCLFLAVEEHIAEAFFFSFLARQLSHCSDLISSLARPRRRYVELYQYSLISILINQLVN